MKEAIGVIATGFLWGFGFWLAATFIQKLMLGTFKVSGVIL